PAQKAFYMAEESVGEAGSDRELGRGIQVIKKLHDTYGDRRPRGSYRASPWLGLAGPVVGHRLSAMNQKVNRWRREKHSVDWSARYSHGIHRDVTVKASLLTDDGVRPGSQVEVSWKLQNREEKPVERASVFLRSETFGFET